MKNIQVDKNIIDYVKNHTKSESLLYNNRIYFMYINPSEQRKQEYNINRDYILNYFK